MGFTFSFLSSLEGVEQVDLGHFLLDFLLVGRAQVFLTAIAVTLLTEAKEVALVVFTLLLEN